jgi:hypothetical protein
MQQNNSLPKKGKESAVKVAKEISLFFARWFFMITLLAAAIFCIFIWYRFVWKADWSEAEKKSYINDKAQFTFNKVEYLKMVEMMEKRQSKFQNYPSFNGRDIFFPENF